MRWLLIILSLFPLRLWSASGDILWAEIDTQGWCATIQVVGPTNGTFDFGWATNNSESSKVIFKVTSVGYNDLGERIYNVNRTVYGTRQLRLAYPQQAVNDVRTNDSAGTVNIRLALSEYIHSDCSNIICNISSGWYASNSTTNGMVVTNRSIVVHAKCIANWSWPGLRLSDGNTLTLRAVGFHRSGQQGRPLRVMRFITTGNTSGTSVTNYVLQPSIDHSLPDPAKVVEYVANVDVSTMTQGELLRSDFCAFPWIGDTSSLLDTADGVNGLGPFYAPQTNTCDRLGTYGRAYAIVATNGTTSGVVSSNAATTWIAPFDSIGHALDAICQSNQIWHTRSNSANSFVYLVSGFHNWMGNNTTKGNKLPTVWATITGYPTNAVKEDAVLIQGVNFTDNNNMELKVDSLYLAFTNSINFATCDNFWMNQCTIFNSQASAGLWAADITNLFSTHNTISNMIGGFVKNFVRPTLIRGNSAYSTNGFAGRPYTQIGNAYRIKMTSSDAGNCNTETVLVRVPGCDWTIFAFNDIRGAKSPSVSFFNGTSPTNGAAFVQNIIENWDVTASLGNFVGASSTTLDSTNVIVWQNVLLGQRSILNYNDTGSAARWRVLTSIKNNAIDDLHMKCDVFGAGNAGRTGNWATVFAAGINGFACPATTNAQYGGGEDMLEWPGLNGFSEVLRQTNWFTWRDLEAASQVSRDGMGDYRVHSYSPLVLQPVETWLLPYDIEGNARGCLDPPGAYSSAVPRKGGFF